MQKHHINPQVSTLEIYAIDSTQPLILPLFDSSIAAGFPQPTDESVELTLDLNKHLVRHPSTTFYARVKGDSMQNAGIHDGDVLIVDRTLEARDGNIVVCMLGGEFTAKRVCEEEGFVFLRSANDAYDPKPVLDDKLFKVWGVVTYIIHKP